MSYILSLGFKSIIYKEPAIVRIYIDDRFVDEFTVEPPRVCSEDNHSLWSDIRDKFWIKNYSKLDHAQKSKKFPTLNTNDFFNEDLIFKTIELDSSVIDKTNKHKLRLEIINANNNYTNGFMTKSTLVGLYIAHLVPKQILKEPINFINKFQDSKMKIKSTQSGVGEIKSYYKYDNRSVFFEIIGNNLTSNDHDAPRTAEPFGGWNTLTYYNNYTKANERILSTEWVGSRGYWDLPFETEWITAQKSTSEFGKYDLADDLLYFIAHKYKQYEN